MHRYSDFEQTLADRTGEDVSVIRSRGFQPCEIHPNGLDEPDDREPLMIDWDRLDGRLGRGLTPLWPTGFAA